MWWGLSPYGFKAYFNRNRTWKRVKRMKPLEAFLAERVVYKHRKKNVYLVADAYYGKYLKRATVDFLNAVAGQKKAEIFLRKKKISAGGSSDLVIYLAHNGLMDFSLNNTPQKISPEHKKNVMLFTCLGWQYFAPSLRKAGGYPLLWTKKLIAPHAYLVKHALDKWIDGKNGEAIRKVCVQDYHKYRGRSLRYSKKIFVTGWRLKKTKR